MKPFSALPPKVLWTLLAIVFLLVAAGALWPRWLFVIALIAGSTGLLGAGLVAIEARLRRRAPVARSVGTGASESELDDHLADHGMHRSRAQAACLDGARAVRLTRGGFGVAGVLAVCAVLMVSLCAPGVTVKDAGELAGAAHLLGVPHPTGFPVWCLLGKAFALAPFGSVWFRFNCFSAIAMALTAALAFDLARTAIRSAGRTGPTDQTPGHPSGSAETLALVAPAAFLAAPGPWLHGVTTEVYALSAAGLAATVLCGIVAAARRDARLLALAGLLAGAGAGGHVTWPFEGAIVLIGASIPVVRAHGWRVLIPIVLATVAGTLVVLYLPVAAARDPLLNWGDPSSWEGLWAHLTGSRIRQSFASEFAFVTSAILKTRGEWLLRVLWDGTGLLWSLGLIGGVTLCARAPRLAAGLIGWLAADLAFAIFVNPMGIYDLQTSVPTILVLSLLAAAGAARLGSSTLRLGSGAVRTLARAAVLATIVAAVAAQWALAPAERDLRYNLAPDRIASEVFDRAAPAATVLTSSDDLSAPLLGIQAIENARPDLLVLVRPHLADLRQVERRVRAVWDPGGHLSRSLAGARSSAADVPEIENALWPVLLRRGGPLFVEPGEAHADRAMRGFLIPEFPAYRWSAIPPQEREMVEASGEASGRALRLVQQGDRWSRAYLGAWLRLLGTRLAASSMPDRALQVTEAALAVAPDDARTWHNLGVLLEREGRLEAALSCLERAVRLDPGYVRGWRSLARVSRAAGKPDRAGHAERWLQDLPGSPQESDRSLF